MSDRQLPLFQPVVPTTERRTEVLRASLAGTTKSTEEAMEVLEVHRGALIARARTEAVLLCQQNGKTHSRAVRAKMAALGLLDSGGSEFWLGAIFRDGRFEWTGEFFTYSDSARNVHERTIKLWRLRTHQETKDGV